MLPFIGVSSALVFCFGPSRSFLVSSKLTVAIPRWIALDRAFYEGTVEDRLQDNFFYVRYDDGESEWLGTFSSSAGSFLPL